MRSIARILLATRDLWRYYLGVVACSLAMAATGLLTPFVVKAATDYLVSVAQGKASGLGPVIWLALALLGADLANTLLTNVGGYLGDTMAARLRAILSGRYYAKLLSLPQRYFDEELTGTIINRLSRSITEIANFLNSFANNFFQMLLTVVAVLAITAWYSWPLALLLAAIYPVFMWLTTITSAKWQVLEARKNHQIDAAGGRFAEVVGQIRVVKSFVTERRELAAFRSRYEATVEITGEQSAYWHRMDVARRAALNVIFFGVFAIIFARTATGDFTIGVMVLLVQLVTMARAPVFSMSFLVDFSQRAVAGSRDYFAVMALPGESDDVASAPATGAGGRGAPAGTRAASSDLGQEAVGREPAGAGERDPVGEAARGADGGSASGPGRGPVSGQVGGSVSGPGPEPADASVAFENVSFAYLDGESVLREVSFEVPSGARLALVGESGGGKTTIVNLLLRLYRPGAGAVRIGGVDLADLPLDRARGLVGVVFQDPALFSGTIRENIAYARPEATDAEVEAAARSANAHEFVSAFAQGYDSQIGERGIKLSGGQKQRISVARAILKDAPILVLDEATSSLDSKSERLVQQGLERLMANRTTIVIAHRLSTISSVDTIVTLREGRVDEIGSPQELAGTGGIYAELLALQASSAKRDRKRLQRFDIRA